MSKQFLFLLLCRRVKSEKKLSIPWTVSNGNRRSCFCSLTSKALQVRDQRQSSYLLPGSALQSRQHSSLVRNFKLLSVSTQNQLPRQQSYSTNSLHKHQSAMDAPPPGVFSGSIDRFNGITVQSNLEFEGCEEFPEKLKRSLEHWSAIKRRAVWFKVRTEHSVWIPHLIEAGFDYHHANKGAVMLYRWLPKNESVNIPVYAHTMLGVGGLVINDKNEILVVSERFALIPNSWKLPGGYVDPGENFTDAVRREVLEETGIECEFKTVVCIRHTHGGQFGTSDLYVVIGLTPKNLDLQRDEREIAKVQWMPVAEYLEHPNVHETNRFFVRTFLDYEQRGVCFTWEMATHQILKRKYSLYFIKPLEGNCEASAQLEEKATESDEECKNKL